MFATHVSRNTLSSVRQILLTLITSLAVMITLSNTGNASASTTNASNPSKVQPPATSPDATCPAGDQCFADVTSASSFYTFINRIYQQDLVTGYACGGPGEPCDDQSRPYYRPTANVTRQQMAKFIDNARRLPQIYINSSTEQYPIYVGTTNPNGAGILAYGSRIGVEGQTGTSDGVAVYAEQDTSDVNASGAAIRASANTANGITSSTHSGDALIAQSTSGYGVYGSSDSSAGVRGISTSNTGTIGQSSTGIGVSGSSADGYGVRGTSSSTDGVHGTSTTGAGIYGSSTFGLAGKFEGNVDVTGTCCASAEGTYRIDDPTDPSNKYLNHSAVTSDSMLNLYTGHVTLDANGTAWVDMPTWFQSLNTDFDYQLTCIGGFANVYIASELQNNRFQIAGGTPNLKVSWQVTGTRHDPYATQHPITAEQEKPASVKGTYLYPEVYNQTPNK